MDSTLVAKRSRQGAAQETTAFGGIAERFRRAGDLDRAIALCREGLQKFPEHLSARVTLGWALLDQGKYDDAQVELEQVLKRAPDNLAAIRGLAELHERAENAVELSLDGPGPWPPDAEAIKSATPAVAAPEDADVAADAEEAPVAAAAPPTSARTPQPAPVAVEPARDVPASAVSAMIETPAQAAMARKAGAPPVAASSAPATPKPASAVELTAFADLIADPALAAPSQAPARTAAPKAAAVVQAKPEPPKAEAVAPADPVEPSAEELLRALDELESEAPAAAPVGRADVAVVDDPVVLEPVIDDLVGVLDSASASVDVVAEVELEAVAIESVNADLQASVTDPVVAEASPVEASAVEAPFEASAAVEAARAEVAAVEEAAPAEPAFVEPAFVEPAVAEVAVVEAAPLEVAASEVAATPVAATEVAPVEEAVAEVSDGFALTGEVASDPVAEADVAAAEQSGAAVGDTNSLSLDFETVPPEPVPVAPEPVPVAAAPVAPASPPRPARHQATMLVLERMLTRVHTRRREVASEYHRAS